MTWILYIRLSWGNSINQASTLRRDARQNLMTQNLNIDQVPTYYVVGNENALGRRRTVIQLLCAY